MAVGTAPTTLPTVDELLLLAYRRASLVPIEHGSLSPEQVAHGRLILNTITDQIAAWGVIAWAHDFHELALTVGEETYTLPTNVLDLVDDGSYIQASETDTNQTTGETPVTEMSTAQWNGLSSKSASGNPKLYWVDRTSHTLQVRVWPVPDEAGTIRFQIHRHLGSNSQGDSNPDLNRFWHRWLILAVACDLCSDANMPIEKKADLMKERDAALNWCKLYATAHTDHNWVHIHSTPWSP